MQSMNDSLYILLAHHVLQIVLDDLHEINIFDKYIRYEFL